MALKCSDISNPCRCWPISLGWASLVCEEFFIQGDVEKALGLSVMSIHDRCMSTKADIQLGFIRFIVRPLIAQWNSFLKSDLSLTLMNRVDHNLNNWELFKQKYVAISSKTLQSPSSKIDPALPLIPGLATLTEETTLTSPCITKHRANYQRRFSLPENVTKPSKQSQLKSQDNLSTTLITFPRVTLPGSCRRGSLPQHNRSSSVVVPECDRRRGSLPLNVRAFPVPSAWEEVTNNPRNRKSAAMQGRRGSAPLIGKEHAISAGSGLIKGCSREQMLLEVYWMTASSSVSSTNSVHFCASNSQQHSSSSSSSRNDSGTGQVQAIR